ncbi:porin family protein [Pedobacter sp. SYP-B3415]|uniref:porin family protein n=1 Tax=Pedobacter sp. SYP-B3415 TaxID=2496641 RepID=UPI00101B6CFC|nr:porin family protein [Pedobacter sp. SYP-B3415]
MKKFFLGAAAVVLSTAAMAQNRMSGNEARFGLKAGVNLSRLHSSGDGMNLNDYAKDNVGFSVTGFGDFGVANNFFIQPGITLQNKGGKWENTPGAANVSVTQNVMSVDVPVNAVFRIPTGNAGAVQISAGPYIGFNISGKTKTEGSVGSTGGSTESDIEFGNTTDDDLSSMDFGANFGLGYRLNNGFLIGANYGLGLANQIPKDARSGDMKWTNRIVGFTVGYSF